MQLRSGDEGGNSVSLSRLILFDAKNSLPEEDVIRQRLDAELRVRFKPSGARNRLIRLSPTKPHWKLCAIAESSNASCHRPVLRGTRP